MKLKPGCKAEYKHRHDEIWPDLVSVLKDAGIYEYDIYLDEKTNILFAVQKIREGHTIDQLSKQKTMQKWWDYMSDLMEVDSNNVPIEVELEKMYNLE